MIEDCQYVLSYYRILNKLTVDDCGNICLWNGYFLCVFNPDDDYIEESLLIQFYDLLEGSFYRNQGTKPIKLIYED